MSEIPFYFFHKRPWSTEKPPVGSEIDWGHPLSQGLVGAWLMNEGGGNIVRDLVKGNNGTLVGNTNWSSSVKGIATNFDGNGDYINIPNFKMVVDAFSPFSIVFALYPLTTADYNQTIGELTTGWNCFRFHTESGSGVYCGVGGDNGDRFTPTELPLGTVTRNSWNNFVFTIDSGNPGFAYGSGRFYKNGNLLAKKTFTSGLNEDWSGFIIGQPDTNTINGKFGRLYIYSRALSPSEIQQLYSEPYCFIQPIKRRFYSITEAPTGAAAGIMTPRTSFWGDI